MRHDKDKEQDNDDYISLDFDGAFHEQIMTDEVASSHLIIETDFDHQSRPLTFNLSTPFKAPAQLNVFLAHGMTELSDDQVNQDQQINTAIVKPLQLSVDPMFAIYDPAEEFDPDGDCSEVYHYDKGMVFWADLLVVNHLFKADGIGMLISHASHHGIPILSVVPSGRTLSPMYEGLPGRIFRRIEYSCVEELAGMVEGALNDVIRDVRARSIQRKMINNLSEHHMGKQLCRCRILQGISLSELSLRTGLSARALYRLEHDKDALLELSIPMIWTIAQAIEAEASIGTSHMTIRARQDEKSFEHEFVKQSLSNLIEYAFSGIECGDSSQKDDAAIVRAWNAYMEMILSHATRESPRPGQQQSFREVVDFAGWKRRIEYFKKEFC